MIGLNLCPFAKGVHVKGQIHYVVALTEDLTDVLALLRSELSALVATPAETRDTTLLILPHCLQEFLDFNDFLGDAEALLEAMELDGTLQINIQQRHALADCARAHEALAARRTTGSTILLPQ